MALGKMEYDEARGCASKLGTKANDIETLFKELKDEMAKLKEEFQSDAADTLYATFDELSSKLDGFPNKVRNFKGFLNAAVDQYESDDLEFKGEVQ